MCDGQTTMQETIDHNNIRSHLTSNIYCTSFPCYNNIHVF